MPSTPSTMGLHFRYRLWIAELNAQISVLRIFDDYVKELSANSKEPEVKNGIAHFKKQFEKFRLEIDELRHEMHMIKMKLAGYSREKKNIDYKTYKSDDHSGLKKRYLAYRKLFEKIKQEFGRFEAKWL
jgi:hypothetical protein